MSYNDTLKDFHKDGIERYFDYLDDIAKSEDEFDRSRIKAKLFLQSQENQKTDSIIKRPVKEVGEMTVGTFKNTIIK